MQDRKIKDGISLHSLQTNKFKTFTLSFYIHRPLKEEEVTLNALLPFIMKRTDIRFDLPIIGKILKLGCPIALQDFLVSISFLVIIAIVNGMGVIASAGVGVAEKLCVFVMTQGIVGAFGVRIPVAFLTSRRAGVTLFQIGLATPVSSLVQIILCLGYFSMFHKKMLKQAK